MSKAKLAIAAVGVAGVVAAVGFGLSANTDETKVVKKIMRCNTVLTNGAFDFNAEKNSDGYDIKITPKDKAVKVIFDKNAKIDMNVKKGSILSFGKVNLKSNGDILKIFNQELLKEYLKGFVKHPMYTYTGTASSSALNSKIDIDPIEIKTAEILFNMAQLTVKSDMNINDCTGTMNITLPTLELKDPDGKGYFKMKGIRLASDLTEKPVDNIALFSKSTGKIEKIEFFDKSSGREINIQLSTKIDSETKKVDDKYMNFSMGMEAETNNKNTIALTKGIKKGSLKFAVENSEIEGMIGLVKLSQEIQDIQNKMLEAIQKGDDTASQKAMLQLQEISGKKGVAIFNKVLVKDKTRLKLDLNIESDKSSFVKLDLLYKADPVTDNIQNAAIQIAAKNLAVVDGTFDIQLDGATASAINPFATMGLDMLKTKGFATFNNGVYHLKGELKGGKIILNGKAYTLQELSKALM